MKRNWPILLIGGVVLFLFIIGTSYAWYDLFSKEEMVTTNLEITLKNSKGVVIRNALPVQDEVGKNVEAYKFTVKNTGENAGGYKLLLEETPFNEIDDGCNEQTLLTRNQLKYQLLMNGKELEVALLSDVKNNILDLRTIDVKHKNDYELRIWVPDEVSHTDWQNKHYHYSIAIVPITMEEK